MNRDESLFPGDTDAVSRMRSSVTRWERENDDRRVFLRCYMMMTVNMLDAIGRRQFEDPEWVRMLLDRFAEYYFDALDRYETGGEGVPPVWAHAHRTAAGRDAWALQNLLLGVNAHINYDLVLTLVELLANDWPRLTADVRTSRHADYCRVNGIIAETIDSVQDEVLAPVMPMLGVLDVMFGRLDEFLISRLITRWRDAVWENAVAVMEADGGEQAHSRLEDVERAVLRRAHAIVRREWKTALGS